MTALWEKGPNFIKEGKGQRKKRKVTLFDM